MNKQIELKNKLIQLGFPSTEVEVYLALLAMGSAQAGPIISKTQLHRNVVYTALSHLSKKKMVAEKTVRGVKHFSTTEPLTFSDEFEQKAQLAKNVAKEILETMPKGEQEITVHQGNVEYLQLLISLLGSMPKGSTKFVIGTGGEDFMQTTMRPIWKKYHKVARAQKMKIKMIAYESQRDAIARDVAKEGMYEMRYLSDEIENPSGVHVYPEADTILNIIYSNKENPVTAIRIKNKQLVQGYLNLFNNLWKLGKQ
jgi:sugar-specific transcriptional regulator TrmB